MDVCPKCGLPNELCTCAQLVMEEQLVKVELSKRRYGKPVTVIRGLDFNELGSQAVKDLLKTLKRKLACGGTFDKENKWIELQGRHKNEAKKILAKQGFKVEGYGNNQD